MKRVFATALGLVAFGSAASADVHPDQLRGFEVKTSLPRGFVPAGDLAHLFAPSEITPYKTQSAINRSYFRGYTELRYSVLLFPSVAAMRAWNLDLGRFRQAGPYPLEQWPNLSRVRAAWETRPPSSFQRRQPYQSLGFRVNRMIISVLVYQHGEMHQKPNLVKAKLRNTEAAQLFKRVNTLFLARARQLPANRG